MNVAQYKKAEPIIRRIECVQKALDQFHENIDLDNFDDPMDDCGTVGKSSQYNCVVAAHRDGSGFNVDMGGACVAQEVLTAVVEVLEKNLIKYNTMLEQI